VTMDQSGGSAPPPPPSQQPPPPPPPQQGWQSTPQPPGPPPAMGGQPAGGAPAWSANLTARGTIAGPAGVALADLPDRIIAFVIDAIILGIIGYILSTITTSILGDNIGGVFFNVRLPSLVSSLVAGLLLLAISAGYFIYSWTRMGGASVGQKVMKLTVRDSSTGGPITQQQAINRWLFVGAPFAIWPFTQWSVIGWILWLLVVAYEIYLLVTTAQSPTRQGFHDVNAKTVVAKG
jgi:uncharacterized RDD family membrane protein YckC